MTMAETTSTPRGVCGAAWRCEYTREIGQQSPSPEYPALSLVLELPGRRCVPARCHGTALVRLPDIAGGCRLELRGSAGSIGLPEDSVVRGGHGKPRIWVEGLPAQLEPLGRRCMELRRFVGRLVPVVYPASVAVEHLDPRVRR